MSFNCRCDIKDMATGEAECCELRVGEVGFDSLRNFLIRDDGFALHLADGQKHFLRHSLLHLVAYRLHALHNGKAN